MGLRLVLIVADPKFNRKESGQWDMCLMGTGGLGQELARISASVGKKVNTKEKSMRDLS